jgi:hypothetical protein
MKSLWILLLSCLPCFAQFPYSGTTWSLLSASSTPNAATFMPGLLDGWEWTNYLATNSVMTNWVGLYGNILTNGDTTSRPTNTASGVGFPQTTVATIVGFSNLPIMLGSNYMISCFYSNRDIGGQSVHGEYLIAGTNTTRNQVGFASANGTAMRPFYRTVAGVNQTPGTSVPQSKYGDITFFHSNNFNGGSGAMYIYTNGIFSAGVIDADNVAVGVSWLSWGKNMGLPTDGGFQGFIQGYYLITNANPSTITSAYFSNIHYYHTNYLMTGLSP